MFYQNYTIVHFGRINLKKCLVRDLKISTNILKVVPNKMLRERERKIYTYNGCSKVSDQNHFRIYFYVLLLICSLPSFSLLSLLLESSEILNVKFQINYMFLIWQLKYSIIVCILFYFNHSPVLYLVFP